MRKKFLPMAVLVVLAVFASLKEPPCNSAAKLARDVPAHISRAVAAQPGPHRAIQCRA